MNTQKSQFKRNLLVILILLFILSLAAFIYTFWILESGNLEWWQMLLNIPIVSIPFILVYGSLYVLLIGWREHSNTGMVSQGLTRIIHWAPRIAAILIIFFISLFSLDVFGMEGSWSEKIGGFLIHNIPSIALIVLLVVAWKRPVIGFVAFAAAAISFGFFFIRSVEMLPNLLFFVLPILLIALLFYADWRWVASDHPTKPNLAA